MYLIGAFGALALLQGAVAHNSNGRRAFGLVQRVSNGTAATSMSATSSSIIPCTTTVTSVLGQHFALIEGSCKQTVTIVSTPVVESTPISVAELLPKSTITSMSSSASITTTSIPTSSNPGTSTTSIPSSTSLVSVALSLPSASSSTSTPGSATIGSNKVVSTNSIAHNTIQTSSTSPDSAQCTATVTSTVGQPLLPGVGSCAKTTTIVTSFGGNFLDSTTGGNQVATAAVTSTDQKTASTGKTLETSESLPPTTTAAPVSISSGLSPAWIPDGSSSFEISGPPPASNTKTNTVPTGTTQIPNQTPVAIPTSSSQAPAQSFSVPNIIQTVQTSQSGKVPPTSSGNHHTTEALTVIGSTTLVNIQTATQNSQAGQTTLTAASSPTTQVLASPSASSTLNGTPISISTQATQSVLPIGTVSRPSPSSSGTPVSVSNKVIQSVTPIGTGAQSTSSSPNGLPISISTQVSQSSSPIGTASKEPNTKSNPPSGTAPGSVSKSATQQTTPTLSLPLNTNTNTPPGTAAPLSTPATKQSSTSNSLPPPTTKPTTTTTPLAPVLYGSQTISRNTLSNFIFGSLTLSLGSAITISGEIISAASTGGAIIINAAPPQTTSSFHPSAIIVGGTTITANSNSGFVIGSQTLTPGGAVTVSGEVITLPAPSSSGQGNTLVTKTLSAGQGGEITSVVIGGQTLTAGGRVTVGGDVLSLASSGTRSGVVVVSTVAVTGALPTGSKKGGAGSAQTSLLVVLGIGSAVVWGLF